MNWKYSYDFLIMSIQRPFQKFLFPYPQHCMTYIGSILPALLFVSIICITPVRVHGQSQKKPSDSTSRPVLTITPRLNSAGHFPFTGALLNTNINADVNIFFEYKQYGFFIFQSIDLEDRYSYVNYLQPGIFRKFQLASAFQLGVFVGYVFSQTSGFRDKESDYYAAAVGYWTINDQLKVENTTLFFDLSQSAKLANRLLMSLKVRSFTFDFYLWHRVVFEETIHATSGSVAVNFPKLKISDICSFQITFSYQGYLTETKPDFAMRDGFLLSLAIPLALKK